MGEVGKEMRPQSWKGAWGGTKQVNKPQSSRSGWGKAQRNKMGKQEAVDQKNIRERDRLGRRRRPWSQRGLQADVPQALPDPCGASHPRP